ncbi:MAG: ABC transporter substrate-binding protein [Methanospirillum sp.]|nr:ABC transporter substrate-binding protein [Methanospirillum sp.]
MREEKKSSRFFCLVLLVAAISVCMMSPVYADMQATNGSSNFSDKVVPEYAKGFTVEYHDSYKVVRVLNAWRGCDKIFTYLLTEKGTPVPQLDEECTVIEIPSERFVALSTTYLSDMDVLGLTDRIIGVQSMKQVNTGSVQSLYKEGKIREVGGSSMASGINLETLIDMHPDLVMTYATGNAEYDSHPKIQEAGIPVVLNAEYMESTPLGRAEWIKFISVFFNKEKEANQYFEEIKTEYNDVKGKVRESVKTRPSVVTGSSNKGTWNMPGGDSFVARFLEDAGADYLWKNDTTTGSIPLDFEVVYNKALDADYWIDPGTVSSLDELKKEDGRYQDFFAYKHKSVYNDNARLNAGGGNDFWESGMTHPQIILKDLVKIFHPDLVPDHTLVYYKKIE